MKKHLFLIVALWSVPLLAQQEVTIRGRRFRFDAGEEVHTEYSHKYTLEGFATLAAKAGFRRCAVWTDARSYFSVQYFERD